MRISVISFQKKSHEYTNEHESSRREQEIQINPQCFVKIRVFVAKKQLIKLCQNLCNLCQKKIQATNTRMNTNLIAEI
ncbi:hypothetical protein FA046_10670 [Pedobacter cryophilus]|uniref:Uncharacterized protein n=1 Tax=Pedobacter cryophilus TaxID=2571271 RepID=A0A4U1BZK4_9SPHI|nr:hypothetical protein FA046_10670 [Pedobacter cryophilus]